MAACGGRAPRGDGLRSGGHDDDTEDRTVIVIVLLLLLLLFGSLLKTLKLRILLCVCEPIAYHLRRWM